MIDYVEQQIRHGLRLLTDVAKDAQGQLLPNRSLYYQLTPHLSEFVQNQKTQPRWIILTGLRGVGKTTLMAQLYTQLVQSVPTDSCNFIYVSLDDVYRRHRGDLNSLLDACEVRWGSKLHNLDRPSFMFIDEIQADPQAFEILKPVYDQATNLFLFCSGSAAINLFIGASVAGRRAQVHKLYPLSFTEYQALKHNQKPKSDLSNALIKAIFYSISAKEAHDKISVLAPDINHYWIKLGGDAESINDFLKNGGLPFLFNNPNPPSAAHDVIQQVTLRDLPVSRFNFTTDTIRKSLTLITRIANSTEMPSLAKLGSEIGMSVSLLSSILEAFCEAEILIKVPGFGRRNLMNSGRPAKYFFMSPTLRMALSNKYEDWATFQTQRGPLLEDLMALYLYKKFIVQHQAQLKFWHNKKPAGCDFILDFASQRIAIEVGWGDKSTRQITATMNKIKCNYGLVLSRTKLSLSHDNQVISLPLEYFLLI